MTNLDVAFNYLLGDEGTKYTNDPADSGGPTKFGITKKTYETFFGHVVNDDEIKSMTSAVAKQIYAAQYWAPLRCGEIKALNLAITFFDSAVLYGVGTTTFLIQRALALCGAPIKLDGILGDKTMGFINSMGGGSQPQRSVLTNAFHGLLLDHIDAVIVANPKDERFRKGWTERADRLLKLLDDEFLAKLTTKQTETA